tara:strand:+ start:101 stop:496 length:396 start_codon:yes stop_codon:yes gene_type:complete
MNYQKIQNSLIVPIMNSILELEFSRNKRKVCQSGYIYTLYSESKQKIYIGHTKNKSIISIICNFNNYLIAEIRVGRETEFNALKDTLTELGYIQYSSGCYDYSIKFLRYLNILGWPIGKLSTTRRIRKSFN